MGDQPKSHQDELKKGALVDLHELVIPVLLVLLTLDSGSSCCLVCVLAVLGVVGAVLDDL